MMEERKRLEEEVRKKEEEERKRIEEEERKAKEEEERREAEKQKRKEKEKVSECFQLIWSTKYSPPGQARAAEEGGQAVDQEAEGGAAGRRDTKAGSPRFRCRHRGTATAASWRIR